MKKIIITLFLISVFSFSLSPVLAEQNIEKPNIQAIEKKVQTAFERKSENSSSKAANSENQRTQNLTRVRNALTARWNAYDRLVKLSGQLLDKLQIRINQAKAAGKNTTNAEAAMTDARAKLADAVAKMDAIKPLLGTTMDKNSFMNIQKSLQAIHKDLNMVRLDAAKIISNLKSFNSSTKSAEIRATTSAEKRD